MFAVRIASQIVMSCLGCRVSRLNMPHREPSGLCCGSADRTMGEWLMDPCPRNPNLPRKMTIKVWKISTDTVFSWIRWRDSGKRGSSLLAAWIVFRQTPLREPAGGDPINACANALYLYYQVTPANLYISCYSVVGNDLFTGNRRVSILDSCKEVRHSLGDK